MLETAQSVVVTAQRGLSNCAAAHARSLEGTLTGSDEKGQDKKRVSERDGKNHKAGRQTSGCQATLVWTCKKKRKRLHRKKDDGDGCAR